MLRNFSFLRLLALSLMSGMLLHTMGCNTMEGAGKDTQKVGEKIENAADRNK